MFLQNSEEHVVVLVINTKSAMNHRVEWTVGLQAGLHGAHALKRVALASRRDYGLFSGSLKVGGSLAPGRFYAYSICSGIIFIITWLVLEIRSLARQL